MKKYFTYFILTSFLLVLSACDKDYLNNTPSDKIASEDVFKNMANVKVALNGIYRALYMQYSDQEQDGHPAMMIVLDFMGEDIVQTATGTIYFRGAYRWTDHRSISGDLPYFSYRLYYRIIANVNLLLDGLDTVPNATTAEKDAVRGECLALRGWAHFMAVQLFAKRYDGTTLPNNQLGVPILTTYSVNPKPRATVEEVYAQINKDLDQAIILLGTAPARGLYRTHVDKSVTQGFKARVALTQQRYADAAAYAQQALTGYSLMTNSEYLGGFTDMKNSEWMWGAHQLPEQIPAYGSFYAYMSANFNSAHTRPNPKKINSVLYGMIASTDVRKKIWADNVNDVTNFPGVIDASTGRPVTTQIRATYMHRKFIVSDPGVSAGDIPFMRVAEMYLIAAEAKAKLNLNTEAADILKVLALNRDPSYRTPDNLTSFVDDVILPQRRIELWGEGFRFLDLKRLDQGLARSGTGATSTLASVLTVAPGDNRWQFLIPRREIEANPLMIQNP